MSPTIGIRTILTVKQSNRCCYCGVFMLPAGTRMKSRRNKAMHPKSQTIEHLHRKVDGGTGHPDNKALACHECNSSRGSTDWLTYKSIKMGEIAA